MRLLILGFNLYNVTLILATHLFVILRKLGLEGCIVHQRLEYRL